VTWRRCVGFILLCVLALLVSSAWLAQMASESDSPQVVVLAACSGGSIAAILWALVLILRRYLARRNTNGDWR